MRLSDGVIHELDSGVYIRVENDTVASCTMVTWTSLFFLNGDKKLINEIFTRKISEMQYEVALYTYDEEAADDKG